MEGQDLDRLTEVVRESHMRKDIGKKIQDEFGRCRGDQAGEKDLWCAIGEWVHK